MNKLSLTRFSETSFYIQSLVYTGLVLFVLMFNGLYKSLDREEGIVELSGAFFLLVASVILLIAAKNYKKDFQKKDYKFWLLVFSGIAFFWASGEEISWGQHMLGTETPEWLGKINGQNETNLHNINKKFFDRTLERLMVLLSLITAIQHFRKKDSFLGFKLPDFPLNLSFLLIPIFRKHADFALDVWYINFIIFWGYPVMGIVTRNVKMILMSVLFVVSTAIVLHFHHNYNHIFNVSNFYHEVRETMFGLMCVFYAFQLKKSFEKKENSATYQVEKSLEDQKILA